MDKVKLWLFKTIQWLIPLLNCIEHRAGKIKRHLKWSKRDLELKDIQS